MGEIFVELADTVSHEFDSLDLVFNLTQHAVDLLKVSAASVVLADDQGHLMAVGSSHESVRLLGLYELENRRGPCLDAFHSGLPVVNVRGAEASARWPEFTSACRDAGFISVHAVPLQLRDKTIGAMNLFCTSAVSLSEDDLRLGRALAAMATIGILQGHVVRAKDLRSSQLQTALNSRVLIEQAKGIVAERNGINIDTAFRSLRRYARGRNKSIAEVAREVVDGTWSAKLSAEQESSKPDQMLRAAG